MTAPIPYTVVGIWADNGQRFCAWVSAVDPDQAIQKACDGEWLDLTADVAGLELEVAGVFEGHLRAVDS